MKPFEGQAFMNIKTSSTHLIWKFIFVRSRGAMKVFATAPAKPPEAEWIRMLDLFSFGFLCNLSPKNRDIHNLLSLIFNSLGSTHLKIVQLDEVTSWRLINLCEFSISKVFIHFLFCNEIKGQSEKNDNSSNFIRFYLR